jgi:hypothetical protein
MASSSNVVQRPPLTVDEMKALIMADVKEDTLHQTEISKIMERLQEKRRSCEVMLKEIQAPGREISKHEGQYAYFLQEEIKRIKPAIKDVFDAGHTLGEEVTWAESYHDNCGEDKTIDDVRCPKHDQWWLDLNAHQGIGSMSLEDRSH